MAKYNRNSGKQWDSADISNLRKLAQGNTPTRVISLKIGRTPAAVFKMASKLGVSLDPLNRSPYTRRKV